MNRTFIIAFVILTFAKNSYAQRVSLSSASPCDTTISLLINIADLFKEENPHYYQIIEQKCLVYSDPRRRDFIFSKEASLIPRHLSSKPPSDFMVKLEMGKDYYDELSDDLIIDMYLELFLNKRMTKTGADSTKSFRLKFQFSKNLFRKIGNTYHYIQIVPIAYPENLTIPAISLDIQDKLAGLQFYYDFDTSTNTKDDSLNWRFKEVYAPCSHQDSAYVRAIKYLDELVLNRSAAISHSIEQIDDLMRLYLFTKEYLEPGSFYKEEATKLAAAVTVMEFEKAYLINDSLSTLLRISRNSLQQYEKTMERLRSCHVRSKVMLLRQGVLLPSDHDENIWLYREGYDQENGRYGRASFGAFAVPARLRLNSSARFSNDFTIGASFHQPWPKNPGLETVFGLGLSAITVDSINSQKGLKMAAFTQVLGIAYSPMGNHFQLGLFFGLDIGRFPESQTIPWIAIGAAYRLRKPVIIPKRPVEGKFDPLLRG